MDSFLSVDRHLFRSHFRAETTDGRALEELCPTYGMVDDIISLDYLFLFYSVGPSVQRVTDFAALQSNQLRDGRDAFASIVE